MTELKITKLRKLSNDYFRMVVVLDDTAVHPRYYSVTIDPTPDGMTEADWLEAERDRLRPYAQAALDDENATEGSALTGEGDPL